MLRDFPNGGFLLAVYHCVHKVARCPKMNATDSIQDIEITSEAIVTAVETELKLDGASEAAPARAADQIKCENGVCAVLWKPNKAA